MLRQARPHPRHGWRVRRICRAPRVHVTKTLLVPYGHKVTLAGLYTTAPGVPLSGQPVRILAAPNNNSGAFSQVAVVTTGPNGSWSATLPPGPSRIIRAVTDGTATILPSSGQVTTIVPAELKLLRVWPRRVPWGGTVHIVGQLVGRVSASRWSAGAIADRVRLSPFDLRHPRARERERPLHDDLHVRPRRSERLPSLLVPDRVAADGELPVRAGREPPGNRDRRRPPHHRPAPARRATSSGATSGPAAMTSLSTEEFLTVAEVAARLRLNEQTVRNWIDDGKLPAFRIGRRVRIARSDFERFVNGGYTDGANTSERSPEARAFWEGSEESVGGIEEP